MAVLRLELNSIRLGSVIVSFAIEYLGKQIGLKQIKEVMKWIILCEGELAYSLSLARIVRIIILVTLWCAGYVGGKKCAGHCDEEPPG